MAIKATKPAKYAPLHPPINVEVGTPDGKRVRVNLPKDVDGKIRKKP